MSFPHPIQGDSKRVGFRENGARTALALSLFAGGGDLATGLCLLFAPAWTLARMGVASVPEVSWVRFVGVFVAAVGAGYFYGLFCWMAGRRAGCLRTVWELTALLRTAVCVFVAAEIAGGQMEGAWISVSLTDGFWALAQFLLLWRSFPSDA
ncbi:hypothetical protein [Verrucomicrobium sp. 3C]|uniref:hypothetical protein n=1 Tax=Verrucomicrobium sp. 3C TaxID=1134055 RepID=UPI00037C7B98|nr:hypothetical protein [Verrucomicrobium sp. 3C]